LPAPTAGLIPFVRPVRFDTHLGEAGNPGPRRLLAGRSGSHTAGSL